MNEQSVLWQQYQRNWNPKQEKDREQKMKEQRERLKDFLGKPLNENSFISKMRNKLTEGNQDAS